MEGGPCNQHREESLAQNRGEHPSSTKKRRGFAKKANPTRTNLLASIGTAEMKASKANYSLQEDAEWIAFKCEAARLHHADGGDALRVQSDAQHLA